MDFDSVLGLVDDFGAYQRLLLGFVLLPAFVPCGFHAYNQLFMAATPEHWCSHPLFRNGTLNLTQTQEKILSIPFEMKKGEMVFRRCEMYQLDFLQSGSATDVFSDEALSRVEEVMGTHLGGNSSLAVVPCQYGWSYDLSTYEATVVTQWDLVCERSFFPTLALVFFGLSGLVGSFCFGYVQDTWGRRPAFFLYLSIESVFGIGTAFAFDFWSWIFFRLGVGFTIPAITGTPFVLALELVGPEKRTLCTILLNVAYSLCLMALAGVAFVVRDWRNLALATSLPFTIFFVYWWILPESPRWLAAHGKLHESEIILRRMARVNGKALPTNFRQILKECSLMKDAMSEGRERRNAYGLCDLFHGKTLRRNTFLITFIWFINMGVYVGLSYYAPALGGNEFANFFIAGLAELPTYLFLFPCLDLWGRRWTLFTAMAIGGTACISTILTQTDSWIPLALFGIGKFGISAGFVAIQQMAVEIYPTVVRGLGISFSNLVGMIGPTLVPLINYTGSSSLYVPLLVLGCLMVVGGFGGLCLPETLGRPLPQSLSEAENLGGGGGGVVPRGRQELKLHSPLEKVAGEKSLIKERMDVSVI